MISSIAWLLSFDNFFSFSFMAQLNEMFVKGGGEQEKGADIDEHFDWHMTHGTYQMREDPGDGRRSDYLSRVKMESTTTNFRQSNERLKNRFMHFFLQFHFIEIRYISANVCLPLWLSLPLQWTVTPTLVSVHGAYMSFQMQTNRLTHTDVDTRTHREGSFFSQRMFSSSIMALWYSAILQLLKGLCWTSRRRVGKHTPHKHRSTDCDWPGWFGCRGSGAIVSSTVSELSSAVVAIDMAGTDRGTLRPQQFSASVKCSLKRPETLTYEKWRGSV